MVDITDKQSQIAESHWQRLFGLSPYCLWVSERFGREPVAPICADAQTLQDTLNQLWESAQKQGNASGAASASLGVSDADRLNAQQQLIRRFRHTQMLHILEADLEQRVALTQTLQSLSALAKACLQAAVAWSETALQDRYGQAHDRDGLPVHLLVIGMGKLGGQELNVSSDIDLIFAFRQNGETTGPKVIETAEWCRRVAQRTTQVLHANTEDGICYRVDTRLRPFGDSGPLVMSFDGMEHYYLTQARNWERYAMVKAAVMAGTSEDAAGWQELIKPFVFRRYLDYSTIESLAELKQKINTNLQSKEANRASSTWNVKLGHGGIREIEFIVQSFQLVRGGREPELQGQELLPTLGALAKNSLISKQDETALYEAYVFLRRTENALQSFRDQQVHTLPKSEEDQTRLVDWMGYADWASFDTDLQAHRKEVIARFDDVFRIDDDEAAAVNDLSDQLASHKIPVNDALQASLTEVTAGTLYQRLTANAQRRIDRIIPTMIALCAEEDAPDESLSRCLSLVRVVAGRSGYLQVLIEQPAALQRLVHVLSRSRWITDFITKHPIVIDELLVHSSVEDFPSRQQLWERAKKECARVADDDLDVQMDAMRQFQKAHECRVAVAELTDDLPLMRVSDQLTWLAESVLGAVMLLVEAALSKVHGCPHFDDEGITHAASVGVVAYGKLGGLELAHGSDLDVVFVHNSRGQSQMTDGERPIPNTQYYARLAQRVVSFMTTLTPAGTLYEMDLRLRPNGSSGVLVTGIEAFERYQLDSAWTWEHQALSRARMVYGPDSLVDQFEQVRKSVLGQERNLPELQAEVRDMRQRMRKHLGSEVLSEEIDLKQDAGGLADVEFIVQYLVLAHAAKHPELIEFTDNIRLLEAATQVQVLDERSGAQLKEHYVAYRTLVHRQALQGQGKRLIEDAELAQRRQDVQAIWQHVLDID